MCVDVMIGSGISPRAQRGRRGWVRKMGAAVDGDSVRQRFTAGSSSSGCGIIGSINRGWE